MKIVKLSSENVKRLVAVSIAPDGNIITIGGKNGAGKTSVLDSIAYALGGAGLVPSEPIRRGETSARIDIDLGDILVTRKFRRQRGTCTCESQTAGEHPSSCGIHVLGETTSTLEVTSKDGAKYPSPQAMLDKLLGKLTFDPLAFSRETPKQQRETLRTLAGIDVSALDREKADALARRKRIQSKLTEAEVRFKGMAVYMNTPAEEVSSDEVSNAMLEAERLRVAASDAQKTVDRFEANVIACTRSIAEADERIAQLTAQLESARKSRDQYEDERKQSRSNLDAVTAELEAAQKAVPDVAELRKKLEETEETNRRVRANRAHDAARDAVKALEVELEAETKAVEDAETKKRQTLEAAKYPIPGLGLSDDGVTWNGLPFEQASTAEQLRVSVAMGLAMNPALRVLLIRDGNALDSDSMKLVAEMAEKADAQVWVERVAESKDGVTVMIQDGHQV